jgi:predicted ABC-type transport system involved in lysophospholipase L1 biosynthesis ATPase subunit
MDRVRITNELLDERHGWTVLMVSTDPQLMERCDQVIEMEKGKINNIKYNRSELPGS